MPVKITTPPAEEPLSLANAKAYLRITDSDDDDLVSGLIVALRRACEAFTGRALVTQTWTLWLDRFPYVERPDARREGYFQLPIDYFDQVARTLEIPRPPLQSVTHLKTYNDANEAATFDASNYIVDVVSEPGRIALVAAVSWPTSLRPINGVEIEFVAGYGAASAVPADLVEGMKLWLKLLFAQKSKLFESDESTVGLGDLAQGEIPPQTKILWAPYALKRI